ncbi:DNA adenine methylase [Amycolatopsis sp. NPDC004368]
MKPPLAYFGGKTRLADQIAAAFPPHEHYVEPFAGSLAVLLAKPRSRMETVNDLDGDLMTFWRVLRDRPDELARVCMLTPHSREEHLDAFDRPDDLDDIERARRVWTYLTQGRAGVLRNTGWRHYVAPSGSATSMPGYLAGYVERMAAAAERLAGVSLECRPALELIERYGRSSSCLLYVDPPYLGSARVWGNNYRHEMREEDQHRELGAALRDCEATVVLSGYDSPLYAELFVGWHVTRIETTTGQGGSRQERTEVLWCNRLPQPTLFALSDCGVPA